MSLADICNQTVVTLPEDGSVLAAARAMRERHVGDVIVVREESDGRIPVGVITDRDIVVGVIAEGLVNLADLAVKDVLTRPLIAFSEDDDIATTVARMSRSGIRRAPVVDSGGRLVGIVTHDDLVGWLTSRLSDLAAVPPRQQAEEGQTRRKHDQPAIKGVVSASAKRQLVDEHRTLMGLLHAIEKQMGDDPSAFPGRSMAGPLSELQAKLDHHFTWEESSDFYTKMPEERPDLAEAIAIMRGQHREISKLVDKVLYSLRSTDGDARALENIEKVPGMVRDLVGLIRAHEAEENTLLQNAFLVDMGAGD